MSEGSNPLVEERVAQLRKIHRRRNDLLVEMFYLMKRKENLSSMAALEEDKAELDEFIDNMDIMKQPDIVHVAPLLGIGDCNSPEGQSSPSHEKAEGASPRDPTPAGPSKSEPPTSPAAQLPDLAEDLSMVLSYPEGSDEIMDVDAAQTAGISSQDSVVEYIATPAVEAHSEIQNSQGLEKSPSPQPGTSESEQNVSTQLREDEKLAAASIEPLAANRSPSVEVLERKPPPQPKELTPHEDANRDMVAALLPAASRIEAPLPIARIESQTKYLVSEAPSPAPPPPDYAFDVEMSPPEAAEEQKLTVNPSHTMLKVPNYPVPPLKALPAEYNRKGKPKQSKKRDKDKGDGKQEWQPLGLAKWNAMLRANPVHKKVTKASKCLSTRDWNIALTELRLIRTFERIDALKDAGRWSFRQPKKQRGVGGLMKSHWDHLLDEMKWMRTDFREERKWKLAVAYTLAHSVMEWHEAGTLEERVRRGICVLWSPEDRRDEDMHADQNDFGAQEVEIEGAPESKGDSTPANDDNSDDDSEDEQEKDAQAVLNALEPASAIREALEDAEKGLAASQDIQPKTEDVEDTSALHLNALVEQAKVDATASVAPTRRAELSSGLKAGAGDTMLGDTSAPIVGAPSIAKSKSKSNAYAHLRDQIIYSDVDRLFLDLDDFELVKGMSDLTTTEEGSHHAPPQPTDISAIFPDLQAYGLLDVPPASVLGDGKKRDRRGDKDDPTKRADDTTYTKVVPLSKFMLQKTTLLGPLEPAKHWHDGQWHDLDDTTIVSDFDSPSTRPIDDSIICVLFEGPSSSRRRTSHEALLDSRSIPGVSGSRSKATELIWSAEDDATLKKLVDKYPYNWTLIADAFNSARVTIPIERRTPMECQERWKAKLGPAATTEEDNKPPPTPTTSMTTRGTKRSLSTNVNFSGVGGSSQGESRKKRRHNLMHEAIRKAVKKREQAQRTNAANAQRKTSNVHDTHGQYSKLPKMTPAELSRMKAEKDAHTNHQAIMDRKRQEELRAQHLAQMQQQQRMQQQGAQQLAQNGVMRVPASGLAAGQGVPQIRSQVNISGQQPRLANQLALNNTRIANSSVMQARALAAQHGQAQAQQQAHPQSLAATAAPALNAHLSPPFNAQRTTSTSPGVGHQSPPPVVPQATAASPRPSSAQAQAQVQVAQTHIQAQQLQAQAQAHMNIVAAQAQAPVHPQRAAASIASFYASLGNANLHGGHYTQEQLTSAHMRLYLQQVRHGCPLVVTRVSFA
ncbi:hypothetical protein BC835DRAFT_1354362 [Cytidiella melzeri]|nr:hypothetical protein BC835DRAFT_1354362 [Cytidiella melzeri]